MVEVILKKIKLWKFVSQTDFYQKRTYPSKYKKLKEEINFYDLFLKSHPTRNNLVFDVGANIGSKSRIFLKLRKKVVAFEPSENLFKQLKAKFKGKKILLYNCALGSEVSSLDLYTIKENEAYNSLNRKHIETVVTSRGIASLETVKKEKVLVETLDNIIKKEGLPKFIKIDVEGYEFEVIKGLTFPVPLISFEANLPQFLSETIKTLNHLSLISSNRYSYNFLQNETTLFVYKNFISENKAIEYLKNVDCECLEVYVRLD